MGGVVTIGFVTSGIAQGCPFAGVLFVCAADPIGRRLHETLARSKSGMVRQGADDTAVLLRSARLLASVAPAFEAARRFAGVRLKPGKCEGVLVGTQRQLRDELLREVPGRVLGPRGAGRQLGGAVRQGGGFDRVSSPAWGRPLQRPRAHHAHLCWGGARGAGHGGRSRAPRRCASAAYAGLGMAAARPHRARRGLGGGPTSASSDPRLRPRPEAEQSADHTKTHVTQLHRPFIRMAGHPEHDER